MTTHVGNEVFEPVSETGWRRGFGNLWQGEFSSWFKSSRWLKHLFLWVVLVNGMMVIMALAAQADEGGAPPDFLFMYGIFGSMFVAFAIMIIMQRAVVGEKKDGTAAWLLSKPVTHSAFIVSRMAANSLGILVTSTIIPGILVYITAGLLTDLGWLSPLGYLAGLLCFCLQVFFWLMLTLMMGTFFDSTGSVIAVPIGLYFALWFLPGIIPGLVYIDPLVLTFAEPTIMQPLAVSFMLGEPLYSWIPLIATVIFCIVFIAVSIWRFNKTEF